MKTQTSKKRQPRLVRRSKKDLPVYVPTDRDNDIFDFLAKVEWANTEHLTKIFFPPQPYKRRVDGIVQEFQPKQLWLTESSKAKARLRTLYDHGKLEKLIPFKNWGQGTESTAYHLPHKKPNINSQNYKHDKKLRDILTDILVASR